MICDIYFLNSRIAFLYATVKAFSPSSISFPPGPDADESEFLVINLSIANTVPCLLRYEVRVTTAFYAAVTLALNLIAFMDEKSLALVFERDPIPPPTSKYAENGAVVNGYTSFVFSNSVPLIYITLR